MFLTIYPLILHIENIIIDKKRYRNNDSNVGKGR